ncbi:rhomboid family intramembrane serine protease [Halobacteria archaeon HArc-gm2]|nr:rhomboid family intramembrane serine protease [Halobacteria archaeon HArc-gm2]
MRRRLLESPTFTLLGVFAVVFAVQSLVGVVSGPLASRSLFALSTPVAVEPWTVITSVYAHGGVSHLAANAVALVLVGFPLERETTALRFHAFFLLTGALAGLAEVWFAAVVGSMLPGIVAQVNVLGASGAIFALFGYLLTSNRLTDRVVGNFEVSPRVQLALFAVVAGAITVATASQQVALVAHFTGLLLGLLAGRLHVLRRRSNHPAPGVA